MTQENLIPTAVYPEAIDPETGLPVIIGRCREVVLGKTGIEKIVQRPTDLPENPDPIDFAVSNGELTYSA